MKNFLISLTISLLVSALGIFVYHLITQKKLGYVKIGVVLQKYKGMEQANKQFASELSIVQSNADTLKARYENLKAREKSIKPSERADWGYQVGMAEKEFLQYSEAADKELQKRQQQLTADVLNKVNTYIQQYGKDNNYKIILGTTTDGSILYAEEKDDLTDQILNDLNSKFTSGENPKE